MAFLGGLMSGTSGAFLRGSLDAASNMIQATAQRDEDEIAEKVKTFGAKKTAYDSGVSEYAKQTRKINDVASAISGDPSLKDRSPEEIQGLAQQLMTIDSANPVKYFFDNRDKLTISKIETSDVSAQTDEVLATTLEETSPTVEEPASGFKAFAGRLFGGASENEQIQRAAKQLGITPDMYMRIMAGKIPTRSQPNVRVTLGEDDPFEEVIKSNNTAVTAMFQSERYQNLTSVSVPDGKGGMVEVDPNSFAKQVLDAHLTYTQTGEDGAALASMQNFALTLAMPKEVGDAFGMYTKTFDKIAIALEDINTPETVVTGLKLISDQLADHRQRAITTPGYGKNGTELEEVHNLVISAQTFLRQIPDASSGATLSPQAAIVEDAMKNLIARTQKTGANDPTFNSDDFGTDIANLPNEFAEAIGKPDKLKALGVRIAKLNTDAFGAPRGADPTANEQEIAATITMLSKMPRFASLSPTDLQAAAEEFHILNPSGPKKDSTGKTFFTVMSGGRPVNVYVGTETSSGAVVNMSGEAIIENKKKLKKNSANLSLLADINMAVVDNPLVFTALGALTVRGATYADIIGNFTGTNVGTLYSNYFDVPQNAEARRQAIELVGSAKDRLFDDPRLSDQDLRLVLQYVAVLEQEGLGTGSTQAVAALQGLQIALQKDTAMRMYDMLPANQKRQVLPKTAKDSGEMNFYTDDGNFTDDDSLATSMYKQVAAAYNMNIESMETVANMDPPKRELYLAKQGMVQNIVENALHDIVVYEALGVDSRTRPSTLLKMGDVDSTGAMMISGSTRTYTVQSLASAKMAAGNI